MNANRVHTNNSLTTTADRVLVTGGGGFLGRRLVGMLLDEGLRVAVLGRRPYPDLAAKGVELFVGDLADPQAVFRAVKGRRAIFHCAAAAGVWGPERLFFQTNVAGTANVIRAARHWRADKLIYTSSPCVVHNGRDLAGIDESQPYGERHHPPDHYPRTKIMAEKMVLGAAGPELATVALRPHLIWGPGDPHLLPRLTARADEGRLFRINGGPYLVDATYIDNAAWAHVLAYRQLGPAAPINGRAYFISQGEPRDLGFIINRLLEAAGRTPATRTISPWAARAAAWLAENMWRLLSLPGEPPLTRFVVSELATSHWFDLSRARRELGYRPLVSFEEGLAALKRHCQARDQAP